MAHYAFLDEQNIVTEVIVGNDENGVDWEAHYASVRGLPASRCKRTSYNTSNGEHIHGGIPFRKNYAGVGYRYDAALDAFIPQQPYPSWTLDAATAQWQPPVPMPQDGGIYKWDEQAGAWVTP